MRIVKIIPDIHDIIHDIIHEYNNQQRNAWYTKKHTKQKHTRVHVETFQLTQIDAYCRRHKHRLRVC